MGEKFLLYNSGDGAVSIEVIFRDENIWLNQKLMGNLFGVDRSVIAKHLKNIFMSEELDEKRNVQYLHFGHSDKPIRYYNLDVIISVGYRVNSEKAMRFRIWATGKLKEFILKGFVLDDKRLKNGEFFGKNYFDELIERVRDIRTSERNFYQKITDIYATSVDYDKSSPSTIAFFSTVQNKMHFGIHGKTAAELIYDRIDSRKENLGITCINSDKIKRKDIFVAKNYLSEEELKELNLVVDMYLSFAELQARNKKYMEMKDWTLKLDDFLRLNEKEILENKGKISKELAEEKASLEYDVFNKNRLRGYVSDFDLECRRIFDE